MNNFKTARISSNISVNKVAAIIGVTEQAIYSFENGKCNPSIDVLIKLSQIYDVTTDYLLGLTEYKNFKDEYKSLIEMVDERLFQELDRLDFDEFIDKKGDKYSKINGEWFVSIKANRR